MRNLIRLINLGCTIGCITMCIFSLSRIGSLSSFFILLLGILGSASSLYGIRYIDIYDEKKLLLYSFSYPLFLFSMFMVLTVKNLIWFIIFWELMTLFSSFLVAFERSEKAVKASFKYFCMTKAGADLLLLAIVMIIIKIAHSPSYPIIEKTLPSYLSQNPSRLTLLTILLISGFGIKMAMVPLHSWLPDAHPEAPSNVSALLSGAMIKLPVYMMFLFFLRFFPKSAAIGFIFMIFGTLTIIFGTSYALTQRDSKKLLAYSSVGQIGYVILAFGTGLFLISRGNEILGRIALMASLFHAINHAFFKGLLFLTAGSVIYRTGSRDLNLLGGLWKKMPLTGLSALVASASIAGMPPLSGFVSKWMIYSSTIPVKEASLFGIIALFMSAITTAYIIKFMSSIFLRPSHRKLRESMREVPALMWMPQVFLASLCILFGAVPYIPLKLISNSLSFPLTEIKIFPLIVIPKASGISPILILIILLLSTLLFLRLTWKEKDKALWACGSIERRFRLPATSFYARFEEEMKGIYEMGEATLKFLALKPWSLVKSLSLRYESFSLKLDALLTGGAIFLIIFLLILGGVSL